MHAFGPKWKCGDGPKRATRLYSDGFLQDQNNEKVSIEKNDGRKIYLVGLQMELAVIVLLWGKASL